MRILLYVCVAVALVMLFYPSVSTTLANNYPTAEDWTRHLPWILRYASGDFTPFLEYPPAFHLIMLPFVLLLGSGVKYLQIVLAWVGTSSILFYVWKTEKNKGGVMLAAFLLASSTVYLVYNQALMPQALDYIIFPWFTLALFKQKYKTASGLLLIQTYSHAMGIFFLVAAGVYSFFKQKEFLKYATLVMILSLPVFLFSHYVSAVREGTLSVIKSNPFLNEWTLQFLWPPQMFFFRTGFLIWPLLIPALYLVCKKGIKTRQFYYLIEIVTLTPLALFDPLRWVSYVIIPIVLLEVSALIRKD